MVMPNIGALIAWGVLTALFIPDGYLPNEAFATMVSPMLTYLIPLLIGYTGGKVIAGDRGSVVGAIATMGVIVGTDIPMMLGAMIMGPLGGYAIKKFDQLFQKRIKSGFEMLVNNFSAGLIGFGLALLGFSAIGPVVDALTQAMAKGVEIILSAHLIPLTSIFIEPAKILFLNNAINHGILTPLGTEQVAEAGKSILFLLEANPGPGLGVLLAFTLFGKGAAKSSAPGAMIIHFLGGIHEIYFPYVMMKPLLFLSVIGGGMSGSFIFQLMDAGLRAPASPGSIIEILAMTPFNSYLPVILGVIVAAAVSFGISAVILKADAKDTNEDFEKSVQETKAAKQASKGAQDIPQGTALSGVQKIIFACDAGMGSSAMGASILRKKVQEADLPQTVTNQAISQLTDDSNTLIVTQVELQERAKQKAPNARFVSVENFLNSPRYDEIIQELSSKQEPSVSEIKNEPTEEFLSANIKQIKEILLVHDDRSGSATMGMTVLKDILDKNHLTIPLRKVNIQELKREPDSLIVAKESLAEKVQMAAPQSIHLSVNSMVNPQKYESIAQYLKQTA
ncbi:PTS mannitol transferase subunit IIB [Enterococcus faecium]|nr:PTS mannitol transferase subunit IIB [Enterococcus faecium]MBK4786342.1 PTS mannitol transferase subunit IIB [Enterococcus faecium]MBK4790302.1 PTS mannitol transferase subunit IIB [Enterococcus faecium]MBK4798424.1 PTS mannitol transferase subunit IIB [Enterococcus faecium]MBK4808739.1 PTS mannitol transferase subunit IIB [Enterococcus faecium]